MTQLWQYRTVPLRQWTFEGDKGQLELAGLEGWELVSVVVSNPQVNGNNFIAFLKRPRTNPGDAL